MLSCGLRVISGCAFDALVVVSGDLRMHFWRSRVGFGWLSGALLVLSCGLRVTFGCVSDALVWTSGDQQMHF